jgi:hypothetical protein
VPTAATTKAPQWFAGLGKRFKQALTREELATAAMHLSATLRRLLGFDSVKDLLQNLPVGDVLLLKSPYAEVDAKEPACQRP